MRENVGDHRRLFDGGDDLQLASTPRAVFEVDIEYPLKQGATPAPPRVVCIPAATS